jgi:hypothetical protein
VFAALPILINGHSGRENALFNKTRKSEGDRDSSNTTQDRAKERTRADLELLLLSRPPPSSAPPRAQIFHAFCSTFQSVRENSQEIGRARAREHVHDIAAQVRVLQVVARKPSLHLNADPGAT